MVVQVERVASHHTWKCIRAYLRTPWMWGILQKPGRNWRVKSWWERAGRVVERYVSSFHEYTFDCALMNRVQTGAISKAENIPRTFQKYSCRNAKRCSCSEMHLNTWNFLECKQVIFTFILTEVIHLYFPKISYFQKSFWNSFMATSTTTFLFQVLASTSKRPLKVLSGQGK